MAKLQFQAYNTVAPYRNSSGMKSQAALLITQTAQAFNLSDYFGAMGTGHFFTFEADGGKIYIAAASNAGGPAIDEQAQGNGNSVCFPIPDGQQLPIRFVGGRELGTGYATNVTYASGIIIHAKLALSGVSTGFLRIYRSSVDETEGLSQFRPPGFPVPI